MIDERLAVAIREAFDVRHVESPGLEDRVVSAIPWGKRPEREPSVPRLAGAFTAALTLLIVAVLVGPSALTAGSRFFRTSQSPAPAALVNSDPRCNGVRLLPDRSFRDIAVYRWRESGSTFAAEPTALKGALAIKATFNLDSTQPDDRSVIVFFNPTGQELLDQLTAEIVAPKTAGSISDTPASHLPVLVGLTKEQLDNWANRDVAQKALMPVEQGGNLLSNGLVVQAFTGNQLTVYFGADLLTACSLTAHPR
jgi:hypothetical protein